ncbi:Heterokaryon incompatibility protein 6, OR allele [Cercospora zeina]
MASKKTFRYMPLSPGNHDCIRLLTILPKSKEDTDNTSPIECRMTNSYICKCALATKIPEEALVSRVPTVNFHAQVTNRPTEHLATPHVLGLVDDVKAGRIPKNTNAEPWLHEQQKAPRKLTSLHASALANIMAHPEETGGGMTMVWSDDDDDDHEYGKTVKFSSLITRVRRKFQRAVTTRLTRQHKVSRPPPLQRQACGPKFYWGNYVALSYEWRNDNEDQEIFIETCTEAGQPGSKSPFYIRKNLHAALRRLRLMPQFNQGCRLWIDFICINQKDTEERDAQMKIMSSIYQRAGNILVWLGEGNTELNKAVDVVQDFGKLYRTEYQEAFDDAEPNIAIVHRERMALNLKIAMDAIISWARGSEPRQVFMHKDADFLHAFFSLRYWRRLWMIQELVMGTADMALVIGDRVTEWRYVRDTAFVLAAIHDVFAQALSTTDDRADTEVHNTIVHIAKIAQLEIDTHRRRIQPTFDMRSIAPLVTHLNSGPTAGPQRGDVLWQSFKLIAYAKCFDPKDRVFGILALPCLPYLGIDHDSKKSIVKVYGEFAAACINWGGDPLDYLCLIDGATDELEGEKLPSWVPDLSSQRETGIIEGAFRAGYKWSRFHQEGWEEIGTRPEIRSGIDRTLYIKGFVVDVVDGLGGIASTSVPADSDHGDSRFQQDLVQPTKSQPWPLEDVSPRAAICACLSAGADENGSRLLQGREDLSLLVSFVHNDRVRDVALQFVAANSDLMMAGKPMEDYLVDQDDAWAHFAPIRASTLALRHTVATRTKRKRLMVTTLGFLGLVPNSVVPGDVVIILRGHGRVMVASETQGEMGSKRYRLKGEAYVMGMMLGEMMEDEYRKPWEELAFV